MCPQVGVPLWGTNTAANKVSTRNEEANEISFTSVIKFSRYYYTSKLKSSKKKLVYDILKIPVFRPATNLIRF